MKTLIVPDVHENITTLDLMLKTIERDCTIFLGDWFDTFNPKNSTLLTAQYLKELLKDSLNFFILGNHDVHYFFDDRSLICSGFGWDKKIIVKSVLDKNDFGLFRCFVELEDKNKNIYLLSHAGFHPYYLNKFKNQDTLFFNLIVEENKVIEILQNGGSHEWVHAGKDRGGYQLHGGCTWMDFRNFKPVPNVNQIVGHTYAYDTVRINHTEDSKNWCIDTGLNHYGIFDDQAEVPFTVHRFIDPSGNNRQQ